MPKRKKWRLLPEELDWTPYVYLVYFFGLLLPPFLFHGSTQDRVLVVVEMAVALPLYFAGYWLKGARTLWVVGAFVLLGVLTCGSNPGGTVLFVYGASYLGKAFESRIAYRWLIALLAVAGAAAWVLRWEMPVWISAVVFSALIGSTVIQQCQRRRLTGKLLMAQEEAEHMAKVAERERIARDLHDLLGHTLSVIILKSELASRLTATAPERAAEEIREVERISRDALQQVRHAVRGYRSAGFRSELDEARRALESAGIRLETSVEEAPLSPAQEGVLGLALRESVTNIVRHAEATACRLTLARSEAFCELTIADDGRGGRLEEGNGLRGMRERVEALGGTLERDGSKGTSLRIRVPA